MAPSGLPVEQPLLEAALKAREGLCFASADHDAQMSAKLRQRLTCCRPN